MYAYVHFVMKFTFHFPLQKKEKKKDLTPKFPGDRNVVASYFGQGQKKT